MPGLPEDLERLLHDLRGPLNSAVIHLEVLRRAVSSDTGAQEAVRTIHESLGRLASMLPAAFDVLTIECGPLVPVDLRAVVERVVHDWAPGEVTVADGAWPVVSADETQLTLAIHHLIQNAVEAGEEGGAERRVEVSVETIDGDVDVIVRDHGGGLGTRRKLPRPFTSSKPGHRGLGLITAQRIARLHGGRLRLASTPTGTEARITLPTKR